MSEGPFGIPKPRRLAAAEAALDGRAIDATSIAAAARAGTRPSAAELASRSTTTASAAGIRDLIATRLYAGA